jgi:hypothetical protein
VLHPNLSLFGLYSDDHELSIAHARVYNDYAPNGSRRTHAARADGSDPLTDIDDAVAGDRARRRGGSRAILLPATATQAVLLARLRPRVDAIQATGLHAFSTRRPAA